MKYSHRVFTLLLLGVFAQSAFAGKIVVNHDEWTLSNTGFTQSPGAATFTENMVDFFAGGGPANIHAYSTNFGLTQTSLAATMSGAGHTYTTGTGISFDATTLSGFDAIFLAGNAPGYSTSALVDYVNGGGSVYLGAGTGTISGGAAGEAAFWNPFLNTFGLGFASTFNGLTANFDVSSMPHEIFDGVGTLYENNGNTVIEIVTTDPDANVYFDGRYAVYDDTASVPEPGILLLLGTGLLGMGLNARRRRQRN